MALTSPSKKFLGGHEIPAKDQKGCWVEDIHSANPSDIVAIYRSYDSEFRTTTERYLRRKIDTRILPLVVLIYEPEYRESWGCLLAFQTLGKICILTLRIMLQRTNKKFEDLAADTDLSDANETTNLTADEISAVQNKFRYVV